MIFCSNQHKTWVGRCYTEELNIMVRFCFASVYGPLDWQKLRESCFIFRNHVMLSVLIFLSCPKNISDRVCKNMHDMWQD